MNDAQKALLEAAEILVRDAAGYLVNNSAGDHETYEIRQAIGNAGKAIQAVKDGAS